MGKGWVDFVRGIHAVTLFGRGFGDLIQPIISPSTAGLAGKHAVACYRWSRLPLNRYYLAARVLDLESVMDRDGDATCNPRQLCDKILWYMRETIFHPCPCTSS